jgi:hypothetical protein
MHLPRKCPSHGTVAGYLGLMLGIVSLTGGSAFAARLIDGKSIRSGSVKSSKLAKNSVTAAKIHKGAITSTKLARNAVVTAAIKDHAVTAAKLAAGSVTSASVKAGSLEARDFSSAALTAITSAPGSITTPALGDATVTAAKLADGSVTAAKLAGGSVTGTKIPLQIVTADGSVAPASDATATAVCPTGRRAFGGGVTIDDVSTTAILTATRQSQPIPDTAGAPIAWRGTVVGLAALVGPTPFHVYAICG